MTLLAKTKAQFWQSAAAITTRTQDGYRSIYKLAMSSWTIIPARDNASVHSDN